MHQSEIYVAEVFKERILDEKSSPDEKDRFYKVGVIDRDDQSR